MRVLLIRPEDSILDGPWASSKWDRVVDLGHGGILSYMSAAVKFGCPITSLDQFRENYREISKVRSLLGVGRNKLLDRFGMDWWALTSILIHQQLEMIILLQELARTIKPGDEVSISGPGFHAEALSLILGRGVQFLTPVRPRGAAHYLKTFQKFPLRQLVEIFWDKADAGYQFRGPFERRPKAHHSDVVLVPTAYVNVSRIGVAYAKTVPDVDFLLVATRRSGWLRNVPANMSTAWLASYARRSTETKSESRDLVAQWEVLQKELENIPEFNTVSRCNFFKPFYYYLEHGPHVRDAWKNVLESEPVTAVLCADDTNPLTHLPLRLAKQRGLKTIACHHGALDGRSMVKECNAEVILAKGKMELDYLTRLCAVPAKNIVVGAPSYGAKAQRSVSQNPDLPNIVLFSEPYETTGGRAADVYADLLPPLSELAARERKSLIIKLHPAESLAERRRIVERFLNTEQRRNVRFLTGPLTPELLDRTWFGITVLSTVVMECALRGVPCFLCRWLEFTPYGYIDQFARFRLGIPLTHPSEIPLIPIRLQKGERDAGRYEDSWEEASGSLLKTLFCGPRERYEARPQSTKDEGSTLTTTVRNAGL
jgi:hypothetical protein